MLAVGWGVRDDNCRSACPDSPWGRETVSSIGAVFDRRTLQGSIENGEWGGYDGHKRKKGLKLHLAVDTLREFLALVVTPADAHGHAQVAELAEAVQEATGDTIEVVYVDQCYTGRDVEAASDG
jgi:hypothetical protein